jgi:outer membrane protein assembly factor BamB
MSTSLYAFDAANGTLIWQQPVGGSRGAPAVVNGIVYTGSSAGGIFALNARTGAVIWTRTVATDISSAPAVVNGVVYVGGDYYPAQTVVYALNALNGAVIWNRTLQDATSFSDSSPAVANGVVYVSTDLKAWAFDASNGTLVWQHLAPIGHGQSAPGVANGVVYLGSSGGPYSGGLYALDASNGNFLWGYSTDSAESDLSSPAIANGMVFFGTADGLLYAFHLPNQ